MKDNIDDKDIYTLAVLKYKEAHPDINSNVLFTPEWNLNKDYVLKVNIIAEALKNNVLVEQTESYNKHFKCNNE